MALVQSTLANQLANMTPVNNEPAAIQNFANAYNAYASQAAAAGIQLSPAIASTAKSTMAGAMTGLSTAGAAAIMSGVTAYWAAVVSGSAASFTAAILITPPVGLATLAPALIAVFASNTSGKLSLQQAANALATVLHTASLGGTATFPGSPPIVSPIM
jgi:hypothetical protein